MKAKDASVEELAEAMEPFGKGSTEKFPISGPRLEIMKVGGRGLGRSVVRVHQVAAPVVEEPWKRTVEVRGMEEASEEGLRELFSSVGDVESVEMGVWGPNSARVVMCTMEGAKSACKRLSSKSESEEWRGGGMRLKRARKPSKKSDSEAKLGSEGIAAGSGGRRRAGPSSSTMSDAEELLMVSREKKEEEEEESAEKVDEASLEFRRGVVVRVQATFGAILPLKDGETPELGLERFGRRSNTIRFAFHLVGRRPKRGQMVQFACLPGEKDAAVVHLEQGETEHSEPTEKEGHVKMAKGPIRGSRGFLYKRTV